MLSGTQWHRFGRLKPRGCWCRGQQLRCLELVAAALVLVLGAAVLAGIPALVALPASLVASLLICRPLVSRYLSYSVGPRPSRPRMVRVDTLRPIEHPITFADKPSLGALGGGAAPSDADLEAWFALEAPERPQVAP